jgi:hypothetical protein
MKKIIQLVLSLGLLVGVAALAAPFTPGVMASQRNTKTPKPTSTMSQARRHPSPRQPPPRLRRPEHNQR